MQSAPQRTVLLTGAAGVIGRAIAAELPDCHVIGMAHSDHDIPEVDEVVGGDLSAPRLGLTDRQFDELSERVDTVVHSGALTEWGQEPERYQTVNIDGTARVVEFAQAAGAPVHYVSTCFVNAIELDQLHLLGEQNVVRPYIWSKLEAERLLAASGVAHSVYRPTNLVGDSRTGASFRPQIVQMMSQWFCRGKAPYFPVHDGNLMDLLSLDVSAIAIARAVEADDLGQLYWLTAGDAALTAEEAVEILREHAAEFGRQIPRPPIVDPSGPLPVAWESVSETSRAFLKVLTDVSEVTRASGGVLPTSLPQLYERHRVPEVSAAAAYRKSLDYWALQKQSSRVLSKEMS
jgi:nucleoside-diphosphate-sugar epimerase